MDIVQLYQDYSVDHMTEGHKHCRPGWVNTPCPFCTGNAGYHLGFELDGNYYYCWRCGWHPIVPTLSKLLNVGTTEVNRIIQPYGLLVPRVKEATVKVRMKAHRMPSSTGPLQRNHIKYLESRNFDPKRLERTWNLVGTGPVSLLDRLDYKLRIIIPVLWDSQAVTFTSRDITDRQALRYRACPKDRELIHHKHLLYGKQEDWLPTGICVEGPTDVWRLGVYSFCTFGIQYTHEQLRLMAKTFERIAVVFDDDVQAIVQANKLVGELKFRGVDAFRVPIPGDPGSMDQTEADYLIKNIIK